MASQTIREKRVWPRNRPRLWLGPVAGHTQLPGVEGKLLETLGNKPSDLYELVATRWLESSFMAMNEIIVLAQREALAKGFLYRQEAPSRRTRPFRWAKGLPDYPGDSKRLATVEAEADGLAGELTQIFQ